MQTSENGISFIKTNEGFSPKPYIDNGHLAWGYGHDQQLGETLPSTLTLQDGDTILRADLAVRFEPAVTRQLALLGVTPTQNQFDALVDFAYNLGPADLATMMHHGWAQIPAQIPAWCYEHQNGVAVKVPALEKRRADEVALFNQ